MCPDRQLLSVYIDGELPSPWKEKLESHLATCHTCAQRLKSYHELSEGMLEELPASEKMEGAKSRIWRELARESAGANTITPGKSVWRKALVLPIPAAVAAVFAVAATAALIGGPIVAGMSHDNKNMAKIESGGQQAIPVSDMAGVLNYLQSQDSTADIVIIRLPDSQSFTPSGEPALVRAADYVRSGTP